jgi:type VI secretion system protein VasG
MIDAILTNTVLPVLSQEYLKRTIAGEPLKGIQLRVTNGDFDYRFD